MKKVLGLALAAIILGSGAFAAGYINANDLEKGDILDVKNEEDGFVLLANADKPIAVDKANNIDSTDGDVFTQRINLKGKGTQSYRCISFPAKKGEKIKVYGQSSSKTDTRTLNIVSEAGETVKSIPVSPLIDGGKCSVGEVKAPADGTYFIFGVSGGTYVYQIKVE